MYIAAVQVLLAMSVYQIIIADKLPSSSSCIPIIGQWITPETINLDVHSCQLNIFKPLEKFKSYYISSVDSFLVHILVK